MKNKKDIEINENITFKELIKKKPEIIDVLVDMGLACFMCPYAANETLKEGLEMHGLNVKKTIEMLKRKLREKNEG